jgi:hypothetical protein
MLNEDKEILPNQTLHQKNKKGPLPKIKTKAKREIRAKTIDETLRQGVFTQCGSNKPKTTP